MTDNAVARTEKTNSSLLIRGAIWIAIGALIAAAIVCVIWVLIGDQDGLIGRAFLTIVLLAAFAGIAILEASLAPNRPDWLALASMIAWIVALLVGAVKIWLPRSDYEPFGAEAARFFQLLLVVAILQLALLHVRLFTKAAARYVTSFTRVIYLVTIAFLVGLVGLLVFHLTFPDTWDYTELYWRIVVALTILAAVGTTLIPLLNVLFAPKEPTSSSARTVAQTPAGPALQAWPTYADGRTPLPVLADGSPDWNAYYTGFPTPQQPTVAATPGFVLPSLGEAPTVGTAPQAATAPSAANAPVEPSTTQPPPASAIPPVPPAPVGDPAVTHVAAPSAIIDPVASNGPASAAGDSQTREVPAQDAPVASPPRSAEFPPPPPAAPKA